MKKTYLKLFTALLAVALVASVTIFYACKKEEAVKAETTNFNISKASQSIYCVICIFKDQKGVNHHPEKYCVPEPKHNCWIWFQEGEIVATLAKGPCQHMATVTEVKTADRNGNSTITLCFKYEDNDVIGLLELFTNDLFVLENNIEEDAESFLSQTRGSSRASMIPAGSYSITKNRDGIEVVLPVTNK